MTGLIVKLIVCPIGIIFASWIFPNVNFAYWYQPIILGVVLAFVGYFMEVLMLREETNWLSTLIDFIVATAIVYFGAMLLDRKSTRLNSSHVASSYAVFCLKK